VLIAAGLTTLFWFILWIQHFGAIGGEGSDPSQSVSLASEPTRPRLTRLLFWCFLVSRLRWQAIFDRGPSRCYDHRMSDFLRTLADTMVLSSLLERLRSEFGSYELVDHWQQGEFHHDIVLRVAVSSHLPGTYLVVATNCNGGIKDVACFDQLPDRMGLWQLRCPDNPEFVGPKPRILARQTTPHWFDPRELLAPNARSELREEFRERQCGGGWQRRSE
jgi:hypothetical protein